MESQPHSLNYELPHELLQFDNIAQQVLQNTKNIPTTTTFANAIHRAAAASSSTPTITTLDSFNPTDFLQKLGKTLIKSIESQANYQQQQQQLHQQHQQQQFNYQHQQLHSSQQQYHLNPSSASVDKFLTTAKMDLELTPNHVALHSGLETFDELQKQLEYDKLMNEVWIGIVFTLILISMVFCICSCFLYHQFRTWKRNYHNTVSQVQDVESMKLSTDQDDPVPEYTLVSGLPSYEAAIELLQNSPKSCLIVYPNVCNLFNKNEKSANNFNYNNNNNNNNELTNADVQQSEQEQQHIECTTPLLEQNLTPSPPTALSPQTTKTYLSADVPTYEEATKCTTTVASKIFNETNNNNINNNNNNSNNNNNNYSPKSDTTTVNNNSNNNEGASLLPTPPNATTYMEFSKKC